MNDIYGPFIESGLPPDVPIYRIYPQKYLNELLSGTMVLMPTTSWTDRYENLIQWCAAIEIRGGKFNRIGLEPRLPTYAQCWSVIKDSDALWRIYSLFNQEDPLDQFFCSGEGVLLRTTPRKLVNALANGLDEKKRENCFIGKVQYLDEEALKHHVGNYVRQHRESAYSSVPGHVDALLLKRSAFKHEEEVRLIYVDSLNEEDKQMMRVPIEVNDVIEEIILDPRVTGGEYPRIEWIKQRGFANPVSKSLLYLGILLEIALFTQEELNQLNEATQISSEPIVDSCN